MIHTSVEIAKPLIRKFEGLRLRAYRDTGGIWTIGYGHTRGVTAGMVITEAQAEVFLEEDITIALADVRALVTVPLTASQEAALVSFVFNLGRTRLAASTLLRELNKGNYTRAAEEFLKWNKGRVKNKLVVLDGLTKRREAERRLFLG